MYPLNKNKKHNNKVKKTKQEKNKTRKPGELDIIMIMIDSISRASAQRYMNKTYQMLEQDASSVILKVCVFHELQNDRWGRTMLFYLYCTSLYSKVRSPPRCCF